MLLGNVAKLGETLEFDFNGKKGKTKLQDILGDRRFVVFEPTVRGIPIRPEEVDWVHFSFTRQNGVFAFDTVLESRYTSDGLRLCRFRVVNDVKKKQRRAYFRLEAVLDATVQPVNPEIEGLDPGLLSRVHTVDLSEGGIQFQGTEMYESGQVLDVHITLAKYDTIAFMGRVVRSFKLPDEKFRHNTSVKFISSSPREQARLCKFIMQRQIKQRRRI